MSNPNTPSRHYRAFPILQALLSVLLVVGCARGWPGLSDLVAISVIGGALGASLHILDSLLDHRTQRLRADAQDIPTSSAFQYLIGRSILGGVSGYIAYNFAGVWHWFDAAALKDVGAVLSLAILAGFSTTTLSVLSGRVFGKDAHAKPDSKPEALSPLDGGAGGHRGAAHTKAGHPPHAAEDGNTKLAGTDTPAAAPASSPVPDPAIAR